MRFSVVLPAALFAATTAAAQGPAHMAAAQPAARPDSARSVRGARSAQAQFEQVRFSSLPWADRAGVGGNCDEIVGRFCLWHDDSDDEDDDWRAPAEPERVRRARDRLITRLNDAAAAAPADGWVVGQRVRYLVEAGRFAEAMAAARACRGERDWCLALEGFTHHRAGEYLAAEQAFTAAVAAMPDRRRREWTSLQPLLRPGEGGAYARTRGAERTAAERRFWWLSDPLWMDGANDRLTEHYSRWVFDRLQDRVRTTERISWGEDLEVLLVRYGWPIGWERIRPQHMHLVGGPADVITHYAPRGREFTPLGGAVREEAPLGPDTWELDRARARTSYAPPYVTHFDSLPHQLAVFQRDGEAVLVAGYEMNRDSIRPADLVDAGLVLAVNDSLPMLVSTARLTGPTGAVRLAAPLDSAIVSVEALSRERKRAGRARYALSLERAAAGGVGLSDVLLLADPSARPKTLEEAWPGARSTVRFRAGQRVGLFWEIYRTNPAADTLHISVSLARRAPGGLRRMAERIGLAGGRASPVRVRWSEESPGAAILGRSLGVMLPSQLSPGEYFLEVTVQPAGGPAVTRLRSVFIER